MRQKISFPERREAGEGQAIKGYRDIYLNDPRKPVNCAIYSREALPAGYVVEGPAVIEEYASNTYLSYGDRATICRYGEISITVGGIE